jgi:hypothetical protein
MLMVEEREREENGSFIGIERKKRVNERVVCLSRLRFGLSYRGGFMVKTLTLIHD